MALIPKVSVFVIDAADRLLVFEHPNSPSAGIQVPAGTLEPGEEPLVGAFRELCEEAGRVSFEITRFLVRKEIHEVRNGYLEFHDRWFFQASPTEPLPHEWKGGDWISTGWEPFRFHWINRSEVDTALTPDHDEVFRLTRSKSI